MPWLALPKAGAFAACVMGLAAGIAAIGVSGLEPRFAAACALCLWGLVLLLSFGNSARVGAVVGVFIAGISLKLNKTLFLEEFSQGQFVPFAGGAAGITIGLNDFAAAWLLASALRRNLTNPLPAKEVYDQTRLLWWLTSGPLAFMAGGAVSLLNAPDPALVGFELWRQALLLLGLVAAIYLPVGQMRLASRVLAVTIVLQGVLATIQYTTNTHLGLDVLGEQALVQEEINFSYQTRAVGTIGHSNILAYFFEITLPLMLALLMTLPGLVPKLIYGAAMVGGLVGVFVTLSRAAWIAVPLTLIPVALHYQRHQLFKMRTMLAAITALMASAAVLAGTWHTIADRLFADDAGSADARAPLNRAAMSVIEQFPIFGVGLNNLGNAFPQFDQTGNTRVFANINHVVHNLYLLVTAETGIVGLCAMLWSFAAPIAIGWRLRRSADRVARAIGIGGAAGLVAHLIHGLFDPGYKLSLPVSALIAFQTGLIGAAWLRHRRKGGVYLTDLERAGVLEKAK